MREIARGDSVAIAVGAGAAALAAGAISLTARM